MIAITPLSAAIRIFVFKVENRFWQRFISISMRLSGFFVLNILNVLASHPPSYSLAFRISQNLSIGWSWGELRKVWSTGYKRNFKLVKEILSFIDIVGTSKVGPEKKNPHLHGAPQRKVQGAVLYRPPLYIHTVLLSASFFRDKKWFTDPFFRYCYPHKELLRVFSLGSISKFYWYISSRCYRFLVETNISKGKMSYFKPK